MSNAAIVPISDMVREVRELVARNRRRWRLLLLMECAGSFLAIPLAYLLLVFWADNALHLPTWGRLLAQVVFLLVLAGQSWRLVRRWRRMRLTEDQIALAIEKRTPGGMDNQLINSLQLGREADVSAAPMGQAVVAENYQALTRAALPAPVQSWPASSWVLGAVVMLTAGLIYFNFQPQHFLNAAQRIFLPLADIEPIYRTRLNVYPGDKTVDFGQDIAIQVHVIGKVPDVVRITSDDGQEQKEIDVPVDPKTRHARYTFETVRGSMTYTVRGGDYVSRPYQITVPLPWQLERVTAVYHYPDYTGLPPREQASSSGDLETLIGTQAKVVFRLNQPADEAVMVLTSSEADRIPLSKVGPSEFAGEFTFGVATGYRLQTRVAGHEPVDTPDYALRATADQPPELQLTGLQPQAEIMIDAVEPLKISARDDYGLVEVGLFYRRIPDKKTTEPAADAEWQAIQTWPVEEKNLELKAATNLAVGLFDVVEGERIELALRARDTAPERAGAWHTGTGYEIIVSGPGAALQLLYERILRGETALTNLIAGHEKQEQAAAEWIGKFNATSGLRWDEPKNLDALAAAMKEQAAAEAELRNQAFDLAKDMVKEAGSLPLSVDMLASSEMRRAIEILESVPKQPDPQSMRANVAEARLTHERIINSLIEIQSKYAEFRGQWELTHMVPFTRMLAERQQSMSEASLKYAAMSSDAIGPVQQRSTARRQLKLLELCDLTHTAFAGMAEMEQQVGQVLTAAFKDASAALVAAPLTDLMHHAGEALNAGNWPLAASHQREAAAQLLNIYTALRQAQTLAAQKALEDLQQLAKSDAEAQKALEQLKEGSGRSMMDLDPDAVELAELVHMRKVAAQLKNKAKPDTGGTPYEMQYTDEMIASLGRQIKGPTQKIDGLRLANTPSGQINAPHASDLPPNRVRPVIQPEFEDLVGELLDEADAMLADYQTFNLNTAVSLNESGDISKTGGDLNSTAAAAATGNMKPPTNNVGGASRIGFQGARAHGLAVGSELINRKGRDEVQEGQFEVPDQAGLMKETLSEDPQTDTSTGIGGKKIESNQTSFNPRDTGGWRDDIVDRMDAPQRKNLVVERQGAPLDPRVAARMYTMRNQQEQLIQRIKALRKELNNLYLPTDHLDDIMRQLSANLDRMTEKPDPDIFRRQVEQLNKLKSTMIVFAEPNSQFSQGLQREQNLKGRVLDEPALPPLPGYEEAVSRYYAKLSGAE